jgi:hypothetical protein
MKRLIPLALIALALAAVPAAFADGGNPPTPAAPATQQAGNPAQRFQILRQRIELVGLRFAKHCRGNASSVPQACLDFAQKVEQRLQKLDSNLQARIAKLQQSGNADQRIARFRKIDARVQALAQKVQGWLDGTGGSSSSSQSSTNDSTLDQAAAGLGQLTQQAGGNG